MKSKRIYRRRLDGKMLSIPVRRAEVTLNNVFAGIGCALAVFLPLAFLLWSVLR